MSESSRSKSVDSSGEESFARFTGVLNKNVDGHQKKIRAGFAALQAVDDYSPQVPLGEMQQLQLRVRSDGRPYRINVRCDSFNPDDMYQGDMKGLPPGEWTTLTLYLHNLVLTGRGRIRSSGRKLDGNEELRSIGFLLADEVDGPFQLDISSVTLLS